jgi:hypothetical protein
MPDFSKCTGEGCKRKDICLRFTVAPSEMQSYFTEPPIQAKQKCPEFRSNGLSKEASLRLKKRKISKGSSK